MNEPRKLSEDGASEMERLLLQSAARDGLTTEARGRVARGLGLTLAGTAGAATAVSGAKVSKLAALSVAKWLSAFVVTVSLGIAALSVFRAPESTPSAPLRAASEGAASASANPPAAPATLVDEGVEAAATTATSPELGTAPRPEPQNTEAAASAPSLATEVKVLEDARNALARRDSSGALAALDRFEHTFKKRALAPEATMVRIEALLQLGRREDAIALARRFLSGSQGSAYGARVRSLIPELGERREPIE